MTSSLTKLITTALTTLALSATFAHSATASSLLNFSGNLDSSSFSLLSGGSFTGVGELPDFKIDDLFTPDGVAFTSGSMEFFGSTGELIPSTLTGGSIRAVSSVRPPDGTPFEVEIGAAGSLIPNVNQASCIAQGGTWIPLPPPPQGNGRCIIGFRHKDIVLAGRFAGNLPWVSGDITVTLSDSSEIITSVTSANFDVQSIPEPSSSLGVLVLISLGTVSLLKYKPQG